MLKHQLVASSLIAFIGLVLEITSVVLGDWCKIGIEGDVLTIGPIKICLTKKVGISETVNCTSVADLTNPDATSLDEIQILIYMGLVGAVIGWIMFSFSFYYENNCGAVFGLIIVAASALFHLVALALFSAEDANNFGLKSSTIPKEYEIPFYISVVALVVDLIAGGFATYAMCTCRK